jgi:hypothetical protein
MVVGCRMDLSDKDHQRALVYTVVNLMVPLNAERFVAS